MATVAVSPHVNASHEGSTTLLLIALFKLVKGIALVLVGLGAMKLLHQDVGNTVNHWIDVLRVDPENRFIHGLLGRLLQISPNQLKAVSVGTFFYASLLLTEGIGLLLRRHWAEYFTIITTGVLIPLELYEIGRHVTVSKILVLIVNVAIVVYLVIRVRQRSNTSSVG